MVLSKVLAMAQLIGPVGLCSVGAAGTNKETLQEAQSIGTGVVGDVIRDPLNNLKQFL